MSTPTLAPSRSFGFSPRALVRGRAEDPAWVRPALIAVVVLAALLCLWGITISGYGNTYYAAAAKAGSVSWKAWFFGSLDPGSFITVDKPPLSLWVLGLSVRVFGFSSASLLMPQALMTVGSVGLLYATVRRAFTVRAAPTFAPAAGLLAAAALALTPVAVALGRFDDPDALRCSRRCIASPPARPRQRPATPRRSRPTCLVRKARPNDRAGQDQPLRGAGPQRPHDQVGGWKMPSWALNTTTWTTTTRRICWSRFRRWPR